MNNVNSVYLFKSTFISSKPNVKGKIMYKFLFVILLFIFSNIKVSASDTTIITVYFKFNSAQLTQKTIHQLNLIKDTLNSIQYVSIYGYTDQIGSNSYNITLSNKRAKEVAYFLITNGVDSNVIKVTEGKGETNLVTNNINEEERKLNRRVIIYLIHNKPKPPVIVVKKPDEEKKEKPKNIEPTLTEKIKDTSVKTGDKLILRNINFYGGRHIFLSESFGALKDLVHAMKNIPTLHIQIEGHICCQMNNEDGLDLDTRTKDLSVRRAKAVYDFLIRNGIEPERMMYKGFARQFPITAETDEYEKMINRRVEIKILKK